MGSWGHEIVYLSLLKVATERMPIGERSEAITLSGEESKLNIRPSFAIKVDVEDLLVSVDYAFQPIVNIHTGALFAVDAKIRGIDSHRFKNTRDFIDYCDSNDILHEVDTILIQRVVAKYQELKNWKNVKLFLRLDGRDMRSARQHMEIINKHLREVGVPKGCVIFHISLNDGLTPQQLTEVLEGVRGHYEQLAVNCIGQGYTGTQIIFTAQPDYIILDNFFLNMPQDQSRHRLFFNNLVNMAHLMGVQVIVSQVSDDMDFFRCRDLGVDLIQGGLVASPTHSAVNVKSSYQTIETLARQDRRRKESDRDLLVDQMEQVEPISIYEPLSAVVELFRVNKDRSFFPVVDQNSCPMGIIQEQDLKAYTYAMYGQQLIANKAVGVRLVDFISKVPVVDVRSTVERIIEVYSAMDDIKGVIVVDNMRYQGFMTARSILRVISEKKMALARDQNPLTKLPGNTMIHEYLSQAVASMDNDYALVYFDFDNFKPFNDHFGFRQGDRAIRGFADLLRLASAENEAFVGHVGGDDFFMAFENVSKDRVRKVVHKLIHDFAEEARLYHDSAAQEAGCYTGVDRFGEERCFNLLCISGAVAFLHHGEDVVTLESLSAEFAKLKKEAKNAPDSYVEKLIER